MSSPVTVTIKLDDLRRFGSQIDAGLAGGSSNNPVGKALKKWAFRYRAAMQERFDDFSRGAGDWPPLAESTLRQRRNKDKSSVSILRDLGILYAVLTPAFLGLPGQFEEQITFGIRVGFGGTAKHPEGSATIADIARFHHFGEGVLPVRTLIEEPNGQLIGDMASDMSQALNELAEE